MSAERAPRSRRGAEAPVRSRVDGPRGHQGDRHREAPARRPRDAASGERGRTVSAAAGSQPSGRVRGIVAVLGMFLVTLAGAGIDSFVGMGLGRVTLGTLTLVTVVAALLVRRRDLVSVVVAPPLVFLAVAAANIALAPSASFNLPTVATLLVRGFPTMAIPTAIALVLALVRLAARR